MTLHLDPRAATLYARWARWMLGFDPAPEGATMRYADSLFRACSAPILQVARQLADLLLPLAWHMPERQLYRGVRLQAERLPTSQLPAHPAYDTLPALSFSENLDVACYFADPGPLGMPTVPILNAVTGLPGLPPHGHIVSGTFGAGDVLFHWQYPLRVPDLFGALDEGLETILEQREVTIRNRPGLVLHVAPLADAGASYLASRYVATRTPEAA